MTATTSAWSSAAGRQPLIGFVDVTLRGAGQVMFQNNPLTGLLFIVGIAWGAAMAGMPAVAIGAVVGLLVSTATAYLLKVDEGALTSGLFGYNGILVGAALPTFLTVEPLLWAYIVVGAAVSSVVLLAIGNVMKSFGAPALTFPFVLTTWFLLLGAYAFANVPIASMGPPAIPSPIDAAAVTALDPQALLETVFVGISQVFLIDNVVTGVIFVIALAVSSPAAALFAVVGSALALGHGPGPGCGHHERGGRPVRLQRRPDRHRPGHDLLHARACGWSPTRSSGSSSRSSCRAPSMSCSPRSASRR